MKRNDLETEKADLYDLQILKKVKLLFSSLSISRRHVERDILWTSYKRPVQMNDNPYLKNVSKRGKNY